MNSNRFSFFKSQTVSVLATSVDFFATFFFKELFGVPYIFAHMIGLFCGGFTQFTFNRRWTFKINERSNKMIYRFLLVWITNFFLSTTIVWILTHFFECDFLISKIITSSILAVSINFFLQ